MPRSKDRENHQVRIRQRPYELKVRGLSTGVSTSRETLFLPTPGFRIRIVKIRIVQVVADGLHLVELYFGLGANILAGDKTTGIDILQLKDLGTDQTSAYLKDEGPRGLRDAPLSIRWRGLSPTDAHRAIVEYTEEP